MLNGTNLHSRSCQKPTQITILLTVLAVLLFLTLMPPLPHDQSYHSFADRRTLLGDPQLLEGCLESVCWNATSFPCPTGSWPNMNVENLRRNDKSLFRTTLELRRETSPDRLNVLLKEIRELLSDCPEVDPRALEFASSGSARAASM